MCAYPAHAQIFENEGVLPTARRTSCSNWPNRTASEALRCSIPRPSRFRPPAGQRKPTCSGSARHHFPGAWLARVARFRNLHDRDGTKWGLCGRLPPPPGVARVRCHLTKRDAAAATCLYVAGEHVIYARNRTVDLPSDKSLVELASDAQYERRRLEELLDCEFSYVQRARSATTT